jgi:hypothetical protein
MRSRSLTSVGYPAPYVKWVAFLIHRDVVEILKTEKNLDPLIEGTL